MCVCAMTLALPGTQQQDICGRRESENQSHGGREQARARTAVPISPEEAAGWERLLLSERAKLLPGRSARASSLCRDLTCGGKEDGSGQCAGEEERVGKVCVCEVCG